MGKIDETPELHEMLEDFYSEFKVLAQNWAEGLIHIRSTSEKVNNIFSLHSTLAASTKLIAETLQKGEARQAVLEGLVAGKGQIPLKTHYITVGIIAAWSLVLSLGALALFMYISNTTISGTLQSIEIGQRKTLQRIDENTKEIIEDQNK